VALKGLYYAMGRQQIGERDAGPASRPREPQEHDPASALESTADFLRPL
jgi:hypothetical protein